MRVLVAGVSVRALAQSAVRAGYEIACLDYFGDCDLPTDAPIASVCDVGNDSYDASVLPDHAQHLTYDAVTYVANLEDHPTVVTRLAGDRPILGNTTGTLMAVRHWPGLIDFCRRQEVGMPSTMFGGDPHMTDASLGKWLLKPEKGGGGHAVRQWDGKEPEAGLYLQKQVEGIVASAVFEADGDQCRVMGITEQLTGLDRFGADGFRYCGNIFPLVRTSVDDKILGQWVRKTTAKLTSHFGLRGVNGIDFVIPDTGNPVLLEVNPRPPASAELVELSLGESIFSAHLNPMAGRAALHEPTTLIFGKAIVYARKEVTMPDTASWFSMDRRDIPWPGQRIQAHHPICTVLVSGRNRRDCLHRLGEAADLVRLDIGDSMNPKEV